MSYAIKRCAGLSQLELNQIEHLARSCEEAEGLTMKLNWSLLQTRPSNLVNDFLCYSQNRLVGYAALYLFDGSIEAEITAMVHPRWRRREIFRQLLTHAKRELVRHQVPDLLFICEQKSASGRNCMTATCSRYEFSEYKMTLGKPGEPVASSDIHLRPASHRDYARMADLDALCFNMDPKTALANLSNSLLQARRRDWVAMLDNQVVSKIQILFGADEVYIYGFCTVPEFRGRGYGRAVLSQIAWQLAQERTKPIVLEVAADNAAALGLYRRSGFEIVTAYDYYRLPVDG